MIRRYEDPTSVDVIVGVTEWLGSAPSRVWFCSFSMSSVNAREVRGEVEKIIPDPMPEHGTVPHRIWERGGRTSWGGDSGERLQVGLFLAQSLADGFIAAAMVKLCDTLLKWHKRDEEEWREPLTLAQAIEHARWIVAQRYSRLAESTETAVPSDPDDLALVGDSVDVEANRWTITLEDRFGATYRVILSRAAGIPTPVVVERTMRGEP